MVMRHLHCAPDKISEKSSGFCHLFNFGMPPGKDNAYKDSVHFG